MSASLSRLERLSMPNFFKYKDSNQVYRLGQAYSNQFFLGRLNPDPVSLNLNPLLIAKHHLA